MNYSVEEKPLGTAAPLRIIEDLDDDFIVMNGDILSNIDLRKLYMQHKNEKNICTVAVYKKSINIDLGVLDLNSSNEITNYIEKPIIDYNVSMGIYVFNKKALEYIPENKYYDFPDLVKNLISYKTRVMGYPFKGIWLDIGRPSDYENAVEVFEKNKSEFLRIK